MNFSMNGFRRGLRVDLLRLKTVCMNICESLDHDDAALLLTELDSVIERANILNCVYEEDDCDFSDLSDMCLTLLSEDIGMPE